MSEIRNVSLSILCPAKIITTFIVSRKSFCVLSVFLLKEPLETVF